MKGSGIYLKMKENLAESHVKQKSKVTVYMW